MGPTVDVVILTWNDGELLDSAVESALRAASGVDRVVTVVDNGSDAAGGVATERPADPQRGESRRRAGSQPWASAGRFRAFVCVLDSDARLHPGALAQLARAPPRRSTIGLPAPVFTDQRPEASAGSAPTLADKVRRA